MRAVLFDLDGTLSDSARGILESLRRAFADHALPPLPAQTARALLGPPFHTSLGAYLAPELVPRVIASYREHYAAGGRYDTSLFPGVRELLTALYATGTTLAVATSKPIEQAGPIIEFLGLSEFFTVIGGDDFAGTRPTKAHVVAHVLEQLGRPESSAMLMVGDRVHDVEGARACGLETIAVTWGYAVPGELRAARPRAICDTAAEVADQLGVRIDAASS